jgi:hypothetical protein
VFVSDAVRDRISTCTDIPTLYGWIVGAATSVLAEHSLSEDRHPRER